MRNYLELEIAGIRIGIRSREQRVASLRVRGILGAFARSAEKRQRKTADISITVKIEDRFVLKKNKRSVFVASAPKESKKDRCEGSWSATPPQGSGPAWQLFSSERGLLFERYQLGYVSQHAWISDKFDRAEVRLAGDYIREVKNGSKKWDIEEVLNPFLYVILTNYLLRHNGLVVHACGVVSRKGEGILFVGDSGAGKSTLAGIWARSRGEKCVLNDDRVIVRKVGRSYRFYQTPWHGDFETFRSGNTSARLAKIYFLKQAKKNKEVALSRREAVVKALSNLSGPFWNKQVIAAGISFFEDMIERCPPRLLFFNKSAGVVDFVDPEA